MWRRRGGRESDPSNAVSVTVAGGAAMGEERGAVVGAGVRVRVRVGVGVGVKGRNRAA
jgi:hypothetical protein